MFTSVNNEVLQKMKVMSFRVSEQQKDEIEQAARKAQLTTPDYMRKALTSNQIDILSGQIGDLMTGIGNLKKEKMVISDEIGKLSPQIEAVTEMTKSAFTELQSELETAAKKAKSIRKTITKDDRAAL
ncbi:MAG: plasmid mobilization protein, partial [Aeromonas sp.]